MLTICLIILATNLLWPSHAFGQVGSRFLDRLFELGSGQVWIRPSINVSRRGNLEYAQVTLDGYDLFLVAVEADVIGALTEEEADGDLRPIVKRVAYIENNLYQIVALDYLPLSLEVTVGMLDDDLAIFASDPDLFSNQVIARVREEDAQLFGQDILELAEENAEIVRRALIRARAERKLDSLLKQSRKAVAIIFGMIASSWIIARLQRFLLTRSKLFFDNIPLPKWPRRPSQGPQQYELISEESIHLNSVLRLPNSGRSMRLRLNSLGRELLRGIQLLIWLGGFFWLLRLYPYSREFSLWLISLPIRLLLFSIGMLLLKRAIDFLINNAIQAWVDRSIVSGTVSQRHTKRAPSIRAAFRTLTKAATILTISIVILFEGLRLPAISLVTVAGIAGFASQDFLKDCLSGIAILWEDQFAIGDVVTINNDTGYVESIDVRVTKLRSLDGELISISNRTITTVKNLTSQWSRLNLGIDVAYSTDMDKAIAVIEEVAQQLKADSQWSDLILEPPLLLGVDGFGDNSITIRLLITTRPMRQWDVGREYRLRLKKAFDEAGITIPFPQRSLWIETPLPKFPQSEVEE